MINHVERSLINARAGALFSQRSIYALLDNDSLIEAKGEQRGGQQCNSLGDGVKMGSTAHAEGVLRHFTVNKEA